MGGEEEFEEAFVSGPQLTVLPNRRMEEKEKLGMPSEGSGDGLTFRPVAV